MNTNQERAMVAQDTSIKITQISNEKTVKRNGLLTKSPYRVGQPRTLVFGAFATLFVAVASILLFYGCKKDNEKLNIMKAISYLTVLLCAFFYGCRETGDPIDYDPQSNVTFMKNTLDYPILVQSYFQKFNDSENFCQKEPIAWNAPILIQPNDYQKIMDYVIPQKIKIFDTNMILVVDIPLGWTERVEINLVGNILKINETEASKLNNREGFYSPSSYLKDDRYLSQNVPWDIYPIEYDKVPCNQIPDVFSAIRKHQKEQYRLSNGYAIIRFFEINQEAACFNP
jgi:hypothetical protein